MKFDIDTGQDYRLAAEREALVRAVAEAAPDFQNETNWIEWKSTFALDKPVGGFLIGKAVLGFANREPSRAAAVCKGTAYMIVGAEPGNVPGIERVDFAVLHDMVGKYVAGVRWEPHYVEYAGKDVLVVVVEPPQSGDDIHVLQKSYEGYRQGTPFHRGPGKTEPAGVAEMKMLQNRLLARTVQPDLDVKLRMRAKPLVRLVPDRQEWLDRRQAHIMSSTKRPGDPPPPSPPPSGSGWRYQSPFAGIAGIAELTGGRFASPQDKKEFESRVRKHMNRAGAALVDNVIQRIVRSDSNAVVFDVHNDTDDPVGEVELIARVPRAACHRVYTSTPPAEAMPEMPTWPEPFDKMSSLREALVPANPYNYDISRGASVELRGDVWHTTFEVGDLRPGQLFTTPPMTIVVGPNAPDVIPIEVIAAAMTRRGNKTAEMVAKVVRLDSGAWSLGDWITPD